MSGGGGGSSGQVSYPDYLQTFHRNVLNHDGGTLITRSYADAHNTTVGLNPFDDALAYDPADQVTEVESIFSVANTAINEFSNITTFNAAFNAAIVLLTLDVSPLESATADTVTLDSVIATSVTPDTATADSAVADTTTLSVAVADTAAVANIYVPSTITATPIVPDSMDIDETALADDVAAYAAILKDNLDNVVLPQYKAGMLNINAITTSAFVIGEALLYAMYDRDVARYAAEQRTKYLLAQDQINAQFLLATSGQNAQLQVAELNANAEFIRQANTLNAAENLAVRDETKTYKVAASDQNARFKLANTSETVQLKMAASEQNTRFKLAASNQTTQFKLSAGDHNTQLTIAASEHNARFKLSFQDNTVKLKLAASDQNMRFKLQKNEIDGNFKINRWKNAIVAAGEMSRLATTKLELQRGLVDGAVKSSAFIVLARKEESDENLKILEHASTWEIDLFQKAANLMASISGGTAPSAKRPSQAVSALSGALSGAATGAAVGSAFPGYGTAIGAVAGAVLGGVGGYLQ